MGACVICAQPIGARPGGADRLLARGDEELNAGHYAAARQLYLSALAHNSNDVSVLLKIAKAEDKIGDLDSAIKRARLATQIEPKNIDGHLELARYLEANRDPKAAELQYERAVELFKDQKEATSVEDKAIRMLIDLDDLERADRLSFTWLKENKKSAECHFNRGIVLSESEKPERQLEAIKEFTQVLNLDADFNRAHYRLALLYLKTGEKDLAKKELEIFIKSNPPQDQLADAKDKLAHL